MNSVFRLIGYFEDGKSEFFGDFATEELASRKAENVFESCQKREKPIEFEIRHYVKIEFIDE